MTYLWEFRCNLEYIWFGPLNLSDKSNLSQSSWVFSAHIVHKVWVLKENWCEINDVNKMK